MAFICDVGMHQALDGHEAQPDVVLPRVPLSVHLVHECRLLLW